MANYLGSWLKYMARLRLAPYVPAPTIVCNTMLELAALKPGEIVCDLGSGDGRLLRHAVHSFGAARATGYELDEELVKAARDLNGDDERLIVRHVDALQAGDDIHTADVVTLYLTEHGNAQLLPLLRECIRPSARVVSYCWSFENLPPTRTATARGDGVVLTIGKPNVLLWEQPDLLRPQR